MAVTLTVSLDDLDLRQRIAALDVAAGDLSPLMGQIGALLEQSARDRIEDTNAAPDGTPWPPSLRATLDGGRTLFASGRLAALLTHVAGRSEVRVGSNAIYAGVHQAGATILPKAAGALVFRLADGTTVKVGKVTIPARPYLGISAADGEEIVALAGDFLRDAIGAGGAP